MNLSVKACMKKLVLKSHDYMLNSLSLELIFVISQFAMFEA
jgi:hypothetical protein